jgi:hypothetical protein
MGKIKEVYIEILEQFVEDVEVTQQMLEDFIKDKEQDKK